MSPAGGNGTNITEKMLSLSLNNNSKIKEMENNRSLAVSTLLNQGLKNKVMLGILGEHIPDEIFKVETTIQRRDRVFTHRNTLECK